MQPTTETPRGSKARMWTGWAMSGIVTLFLIFDIVIHLTVIAPVVDSFNQLGLPIDLSVVIGIIELGCVIMYWIPRTSIIGAILQTGYLGGAVAIQLRVHAPLFSTSLFPIYVGLLLWGGLYLRDGRVRALLSPGKG